MLSSKKNNIIKTGIACLLIPAIALASNSPLAPVTINVAAVDFDGDFDTGTFDVWDGTTYDFSWYSPTATEYVINSAAQFAALSILTNNLTSGFSNWASTLPANCASYLDINDNFEGKTITLNVDIDLNNKAWLPISYAFNTPNITHADYDALSQVPAYLTAVDPWVGDGNGNKIITRYLEFPESEMRFRDLLYLVNSDEEINEIYDHTYTGKYDGFTPYTRDAKYNDGNFASRISYNKLLSTYSSLDGNNPTQADIKNGIQDVLTLKDGQFSLDYWMPMLNELAFQDLDHIIDKDDGNGHITSRDAVASHIMYYVGDVEVPIVSMRELGTQDIVKSYTYVDLHSADCPNKGFNGTFNGNGRRVKGLHPSTPWTDDPTTRLNTFDPIAKGLFSVLDTEGKIENLNIKGAYVDTDVCSYSAFMCAYNYGVIDHCYVYGNMEQGTIYMQYPITRDYGEYSAEGEIITPSTYTYAEGTVLPVGNSGFMTAYNEGTISNSFTAGEVTQAFRQFGFLACTNVGTITDCINSASFSTSELDWRNISFHTDEWDLNHEDDSEVSYYPFYDKREGDRYNVLKNYWNDYGYWQYNYSGTYGNEISVNSTNTAALNTVEEYAADLDKTPQWGNLTFEQWLDCAWTAYFTETDCMIPALSMPSYYQGSDIDGNLWIPSQNNLGDAESLAANHLYGVYGLTTVGGICAVNTGLVENCINRGTIARMLNTSFRNDVTYDNTQDGYCYIRPSNVYGMFSTQTSTVAYQAGICGVNQGGLTNVKNEGTIDRLDGVFYIKDKVAHLKDNAIASFMYMPNGFYRSGCILENGGAATTLSEFYPTNMHWWWDFLPAEGEGVIRDHAGQDNFGSWNLSTGTPQEVVHESWDHPGYHWESTDGSTVIQKSTGLPVTEITIEPQQNPDILDCSSNMPYPVFIKSFGLGRAQVYYDLYSTGLATADTEMLIDAGITAYNTGRINTAENTGKASYGIVHISDGLQDIASMKNLYQNYDGSIENLAFIIKNTTVEDSKVQNSTGADYGIARYALSNNGKKMSLEDIKVLEGRSGYLEIKADESNFIDVKNNAILDSAQPGEGLSVTSYNATFNGAIVTQPSDNGIGKLVNCNLDNIYIFADCIHNGVAYGTLSEYARNVTFGGSSAEYAIGTLTGGEMDKILVCTIDTTGTLGECQHLLYLTDSELSNMNVFALVSGTGLRLSGVVADDLMIYLDTPDLGTSADYNVTLVEDTTLRNVLLETNVNITLTDPMSHAIAAYPGVLKAIKDTNIFENVVIQTPNACLSYPSYNFMLPVDTTILTDALLNKDENARESGSMAYFADKGNTAERTYDYTVATEDILNMCDATYLDIMDSLQVKDSTLDTVIIAGNGAVPLPQYTRKKTICADDARYEYDTSGDKNPTFYRVLIPYTYAGAGDIVATYTYGTLASSTHALAQVYPQTAIYVPEGKDYTINITEEPGYGITHLYKTTLAVEREDTDFEVDTDMTFTMEPSDVTWDSEWEDTHAIEVQASPYFVIQPSANGAVAGTEIYVDIASVADDKEIDKVWYYEYKKDSNNRWVLDEKTEHEIELSTMSFIMPSCPVKIFAHAANTTATVTRFVIAGTEGIIDNVNHTITLELPKSVDATSIAPTLFKTDAVSVSPDVNEKLDFTKPVVYTLMCENGDSVEYTVEALAADDGEIAYFELRGYKGIIDQDAGTILVNIPLEMNLSAITPNIVWNGASITPEGMIDLSSLTAEYVVTSSSGVEKTYTVTVVIADSDSVINELLIDIGLDTPVLFTVNDTDKTITANIPYGLDVSDSTISNFRFSGLSANLNTGDTINLSKTNYLVLTDLDGISVSYRIFVIEGKNTDKYITQFMLLGNNGVIDESEHTITLAIPSYYDLSDLPLDAIVFVGKSVNQDIFDKHNWEDDDITCTITAYDDSTVTYSVIVERT